MKICLIWVTDVKGNCQMKTERSGKPSPSSSCSPPFTYSVGEPTFEKTGQPWRVGRLPVLCQPHVSFRACGSRLTPTEPTTWQNTQAHGKSEILHGEKGQWPPGRDRRSGDVNKSIQKNGKQSSLGRHTPARASQHCGKRLMCGTALTRENKVKLHLFL